MADTETPTEFTSPLLLGITEMSDRWSITINECGEGTTVQFPGSPPMVKTATGWITETEADHENAH